MKEKKRLFKTKIELLEYLSNVLVKDKYAILAGHYILDYSNHLNQLLPLIKNENNGLVNDVAQIEVGDFPFASFKLGVNMKKMNQNSNSKIILLVNDHKIPSKFLYRDQLNLSQLRREYYIKNRIPKKYKNFLMNEGFETNSVLLNNNKLRKTEEVLQSETYLFSEYIIRKQFDNSLKKKLLKLEEIFTVDNNGNKKKIFYQDRDIDVCLVDDKNCGCNGEIMQLIYNLAMNKDYHNFIFIVPSECANAVSEGIRAVSHFFHHTKPSLSLKFHLISGLPEDPYSKTFFKSIYLESYEI